MLQFDSIQLLLLVLAVTTFSNEVFQTNGMLPINLIAQIGNTEIKHQTIQNEWIDNQSQVSDDKNEANNVFLIEPPKKSVKVYSSKSLIVEIQEEELLKESSEQNESELSQEQRDEQQRISIKVSKKVMQDTEIAQENNLKGENSVKQEELKPIQNDKMPTKITQENQVIENNDENEITIQDIKIESIQEEPVSQREETKSQNEDVIIIKIDEEIKATPKVFGILDNNDSIKSESLEDELISENDQDQDQIEQCEGEELDTIHSQQENKRQELNKSTIDQKNDGKTAKKTNEKSQKQSTNVLSNNKKQQNSKRNEQPLKDQSINSNEADQKLIGELIKVQPEVDVVDLSIFADDNSDLIPIIVEDSENTIVNDPENEIQDTQPQQEISEITQQDTIIEVNQELNQDTVDVIATQNLDIDGGSFEDFQSELDELARELDQLSLDTTQSSNGNGEGEHLEEESSNDSLQYITISTNNDPIIANNLEDDYFLDDLENELGEQTQQQDDLNSAIESTNEQEGQILVVNNPEQLIIQKENQDEDQLVDDNQIESQTEQQYEGESSKENEINISIDNNNDQELSSQDSEDNQVQQSIDSEDNQVQDDSKQSLDLDNEVGQFQIDKSNEFKEVVDIKKNSVIKKEVSVSLDNMITNESINDQVGLTDDDFLRIAAESEAEVIENLEDLQDGMENVQFDKKTQNQIQAQPDKGQRIWKRIEDNKEYSLKIDSNKQQRRFEEDNLDQVKNTQIRDQYQRSKEDEFNKMINDLINEFDFKNQRERDVIDYDSQITQKIIENMEELRYANRVFNRDWEETEDEDEEYEAEDVHTYQESQKANTEVQKEVQNKKEFERECKDQASNSAAISDYEKDMDKRKQEVIDRIKKELKLKRERLKNINNQKSDKLNSYDFERIYLDWATNKEDIVYNILLHTNNQDKESQVEEEVQNAKVERISKKQEVEEELQKLYSNYERKGRHLRGQR
ncbi:unnamed protein product (macronuclear) [Paramecium tetraurelia]|uniref:Uncharacterized protein n=1 Tax=Paramecium tetraurelia TaxID=5888 RepID=A0EEH7_PARTE|nr:uncharacterized protein GSPATT00026040001 [Paramecium tetraurelia]CAK93706.1 unnamed protein product [Paramecium tetraurelia]|eukprot:XP_001461091.1 hypothetical protein (macronuclear) [Paramecium tetraurelia strain d4-2]